MKDPLQLRLELLTCLLEVINLFRVSLLFRLSSLDGFLLNHLTLDLEVTNLKGETSYQSVSLFLPHSPTHLFVQFCLFELELTDVGLHLRLPRLGFERLPDTEGDAGLVEGLVSQQRHPQLIPDPEHQQPPLSTVYGGLADEFVKTLRVQLTSNLNIAF